MTDLKREKTRVQLRRERRLAERIKRHRRTCVQTQDLRTIPKVQAEEPKVEPKIEPKAEPKPKTKPKPRPKAKLKASKLLKVGP